jgi:hypothetical protein
VPLERDFGLKIKIEVGFPTRHSIRQADQSSAVLEQAKTGQVQGRTRKKFSGDNDETSNNFDTKKWNDTVKQLDQVMVELENRVETADDKKLQTWASEIAHIGTHKCVSRGTDDYCPQAARLVERREGREVK